MTILELSGELEAVLHGTTLNKITNIYGVYNRAARQLLLDLDPQETKRICELTNPIYNKVYDYALPTDLKGNRIIDIRPQVNRTMRDNYAQLYGKDFDISKEYSLNPSFDVQFNSGVKTIRINSPLIQTGIVINYAEGITGNGTWAVDGVNATTLTTDSVNYVGGQNSLKFNLTNTGVNPTVGYIENSTMSAVDLSSHENQSSLFFYVYLPDASDFTNLILRWGSSTASYWTATATTDFFGNAFVDGWNLIRVNWTASTTEVGTPNSSAVNYLRISYTYDGVGQTAVRLNNIVSNLGQIMEIVYYSKYLFRSAAGAWQETATATTDLINLDTESYSLFLYLCALYCTQQALGEDMTYDTQIWQTKYNDALTRYRSLYKSEVQLPTGRYYRRNQTGWRQFFGRSFNY